MPEIEALNIDHQGTRFTDEDLWTNDEGGAGLWSKPRAMSEYSIIKVINPASNKVFQYTQPNSDAFIDSKPMVRCKVVQ